MTECKSETEGSVRGMNWKWEEDGTVCAICKDIHIDVASIIMLGIPLCHDHLLERQLRLSLKKVSEARGKRQ